MLSSYVKNGISSFLYTFNPHLICVSTTPYYYPDVPDAHLLYSYVGNTDAPIGEHFDDQENDGILCKLNLSVDLCNIHFGLATSMFYVY